MKRLWVAVVTTALVALFALGLVMPNQADAFLIRLAAHFNSFTGEHVTGAISAAGGAGGAVIYGPVAVFAPSSGVLYITMYTNADQHRGAAQDFTCFRNGVVCNPANLAVGPAGGAPTGWIRMQRTPAGTGATNCNQGAGGDGDCHDNTVTYLWCSRVGAGTHSVFIKQAVSAPAATGKLVFVEKSHFTIDFSSSSLGSPASCSAAGPLPLSAHQ